MGSSKDNTALEVVDATVKAALSLVPGGGAWVEIWNLVGPFKRRQQKWIDDVGTVLQQLQDRVGLLPQEVLADDRFASSLIQATAIAMKSHQAEKRQALRSGLYAAASNDQRFDDDLSALFFRFVDELGVTHLQLLNALAAERNEIEQDTSLEGIWNKLTDPSGKRFDLLLFRSAMEDLRSRFLVWFEDIEDFPEFASKKSLLAAEDSGGDPIRVTPLALKFLEFIREPVEHSTNDNS
jgi:hypothetical protein